MHANSKAPNNRAISISCVTAAAICALAALVMPAPAGATVVERNHYEGTDSGSYDFCGFDVQVDVTFHGVMSFRAGKGKFESAFFAHDKFWFTETHSANGRTFTISGNGLFQETRAVPLGGSLFEFSSVQAGQPFVVRDGNGEVLLRDRGAIKQTVVFHTLGDDEPGGIFIDEVDLQIAGPHPGFFIDPTAACALLGPDPI